MKNEFAKKKKREEKNENDRERRRRAKTCEEERVVDECDALAGGGGTRKLPTANIVGTRYGADDGGAPMASLPQFLD